MSRAVVRCICRALVVSFVFQVCARRVDLSLSDGELLRWAQEKFQLLTPGGTSSLTAGELLDCLLFLQTAIFSDIL